MINHPMSATNVRLLLPEILWLEPEHFEQAKITNPANNEQQQWQFYLNALATFAFSAWLEARLLSQSIQQGSEVAVAMGYLKIGELKLGLVAVEQVLDESVNIPKIVTLEPQLAAHFYVVLEVLEEQEKVMIRGFLRHSELVAYRDREVSSNGESEYCLIPLSALDGEINHLIIYIQQIEPSIVALPMVTDQAIAAPAQTGFSQMRTHLGQWLQGVLDDGWQTIETLINPEANLAWNTRQTFLGTKGGKLINFGVQLNQQTVALLVTVTPESEGKIGIGVQVVPVGGVPILPAQLRLTLISSSEKILQEVQSREQDNYIQLKPFKGKPGINFSIEVSLNDVKVRETFEL
mgnify:CR=1 FL=1